MSTAPSAVLPLPISTDADRITTATLEPNQGPMCILDESLIRRIELTLKSVPSDSAGFILASGSPRVFVAGADLKSIMAMDHDGLEHYLAFGQRVFGMLCALKCPTVAAINGAALGGGLELAMHCDALIAAPAPAPSPDAPSKPYPIGLPEAGLQICPGWGGTNLLPARVKDPADAMRRTCIGKPWLITDAHSAGLLDVMCDTPETLLPTCKRWLLENRNIAATRRDQMPSRWIGRDAVRNACTAALVNIRVELGQADPAKSCLQAIAAGLEHGWPAALKAEREQLNRLRATPAGAAAIQAFFDKSAKK